MPRALVINPWVTDFKLYDEWMHPVGLYLLMSLLKHNGWEFDYVNCLTRAERAQRRYGTGAFESVDIPKPPLFESIPRSYKRYGIGQTSLTQRLSALPTPDLILIGSSMTYWLEGVRQTIALASELFPALEIVAGGIGARLMPRWVATQCACTVVDTALHPDSGSVALGKYHTLDTTGWQIELITGLLAQGNRKHGPVLGSLGCPLSCSYCASSRLYPAYLPRDPAQVAREITFCATALGVRDFAFVDDALLYKKEELFYPLLNAIDKAGHDLRFHLPNGIHVKWFDTQTARLMAKTGFSTIRFGYESAISSTSQHTGRKASQETLARAVEIAVDNGLGTSSLGVYIMGGLPGIGPDQMLEELEWVSSLGVAVKPVFLSPVPGTRLFDQLCASDPLLATDPHRHNDTWFITTQPGWDSDSVQSVRDLARSLNNRLTQSTHKNG